MVKPKAICPINFFKVGWGGGIIIVHLACVTPILIARNTDSRTTLHYKKIFISSTLNEKSRECQNHEPQPTNGTIKEKVRKRDKSTDANRTIKCIESITISSLSLLQARLLKVDKIQSNSTSCTNGKGTLTIKVVLKQKQHKWKAKRDSSFPIDGYKAILNKLNNKSKTNRKRTNIDN